LFHIAPLAGWIEMADVTKPFLQEYDRVLRPLYREKIAVFMPQESLFKPLSNEDREAIRLKMMGASVESTMQRLPEILAGLLDVSSPHLRDSLYSQVNQVIRDFRQKHHRELSAAFFQSQLTSEQSKLGLTHISVSAKRGDVKAQLPNLLERLRKATAERGKKSTLAKFLGVPLANVSQWLSGVREPGGETTLRMLHWVEQQERK
jgi:DNA-binding transcriptional regulator YiaG